MKEPIWEIISIFCVVIVFVFLVFTVIGVWVNDNRLNSLEKEFKEYKEHTRVYSNYDPTGQCKWECK